MKKIKDLEELKTIIQEEKVEVIENKNYTAPEEQVKRGRVKNIPKGLKIFRDA